MKVYIHYAFVLLVITAIACGILAVVNNKTKDVILLNQSKSEDQARSQVIVGATKFDKIISKISDTDSLVYYTAKNDQGQLLGYAFIASGKGYSGEVKTMVGVDTTLTIKTILVIQQTETPGLGANSTKVDFPDRFKNLKSEQLKVDKDGGQIKSISGATITTRAITNAIKLSLDKLQIILKAPTTTPAVQDSVMSKGV